MKALEFYGSRDEDYLRLSLNGAFSTQTALESEFAPFLQALEEYADGWSPDVVRGKRQRRYSRAAIWKSLEEQRDENSTSIGLYRTEWPALDMSLGLWLPPQHPKLTIIMKVKKGRVRANALSTVSIKGLL